MKRTVLLTNFQMINYSGSELDTLTIADYFLKNNYDVSIFTIEYGLPLYNEIDDRIKIISMDNIKDLKNHYNLIWSHHYPLLDYLFFSKKVSADYVHYVSLSSYNGYEALPEYYSFLNLTSVLSFEAINTLKEEKYNVDNIHLFTNYSLLKNFKHIIKKTKLKKICIISNHVPKELIEFSEIFKFNFHKDVDIYGMGYNFVKVTSSLLKKYDLVITIGRTVNDAIALGIPVYCYDHFGGDGYITMNNVENSYKYNFSGRYSGRKLTGEEIYHDVIDNYEKCVCDLIQLRKFAFTYFCFENMMNEALTFIYNTEKFDINSLLQKFPYLKRKGPLFYEKISQKKKYIDRNTYNLNRCQLYFDYGDGFSENNSTVLFYKKKNNIYFIDYNIPDGVNNIRFDFSFSPLTRVNKIIVNRRELDLSLANNCIIYKGNSYLSINNDPNIILNVKKRKLHIEVDMSLISVSDLINNLR